MIYNEVSKFFSRPAASSVSDGATAQQFFSEVQKVAHEPPIQLKDLKKDGKTNNAALKSELGGISCLDISDVSNKSPHNATQGKTVSIGRIGLSPGQGTNMLPLDNGMNPLRQSQTEMAMNEAMLGSTSPEMHLNLQGVNGAPDSKMLADYRQTKAFQTLLRRQAQAVRKIQRIKSSFTKKRQQITMLAVAPMAKKSGVPDLAST